MTCFSLNLEVLNWVHGHQRGQRSAAVNRAIVFYMHAGAVMESRDQLQELVYEYSEKIASLEDENQCLKESIEVIA
jgi:hypothetical protein